jgi:hypothetical protein
MYSARSWGVRRPLRGGDISSDGPCPRGDCGVPARGLGVVFLGGVLEIFALGKRENPPEGPFDDILSEFVMSPNSVSNRRSLFPNFFFYLSSLFPRGPGSRISGVASAFPALSCPVLSIGNVEK